MKAIYRINGLMLLPAAVSNLETANLSCSQNGMA
jgi:hypothetical protein